MTKLNLYILGGAAGAGLIAAFFVPPVVGPVLFGAVVGVGAWFAAMFVKDRLGK